VRFAGLEVDHKFLVGALVLGQAVGFIGSAVGGNEARRKGEQVTSLNQKLLKVNAELRREMREAGIGPYQPIPASRFIEKSADSTDEDDETVARVISSLKTGKRLLKEGDDLSALANFKAALADVEANPGSFNEGWKASRKAHRGMGAALERLGKFKPALESMKIVLALSTEHDDHSGETDALGVIADIYADMDELEEAAEYYDKYFNSLQEEDARNAASAEVAAKKKLTS
jgi:tetratricopeptide (TPR) repeat protein